MATFTWKDFFNGNIAVTCKTQQEYNAFMQACEDVGAKWQEDINEPATRHPDYFEEHGPKTTIGCDKLTYLMQYATPAIWYSANYDVVFYEDIDELKKRPTAGAQAVPKPDITDELSEAMAEYVTNIIKIADKYKKDRNDIIKNCTGILFKNVITGNFINYKYEVPANE